ncbi:MAG: hypothetical protein PVI81_01590 [Anaerolineales bacterium]|jgi:hypothetical protein
MLPTWRDVELQTEIRRVRVQEAADWRILSQLSNNNTELSAYATVLVSIGNWMVRTGEQLRSPYGDVGQIEKKLRSLEQGC